MELQARRPCPDELRHWLVEYLAQLLGTGRDAIDPRKSFELLGLDSSGAVGLSGDLELLLGVEFDTALVYDYPSVEQLVAHLESRQLLWEPR